MKQWFIRHKISVIAALGVLLFALFGGAFVLGGVSYTTQGPTDEPTGTRATSATLILTNGPNLREWLDLSTSEDQADSKVVYDDVKPKDVAVIETAKGSQQLYVTWSRRIICVTRPTTHTDESGNSRLYYDIQSCVQIVPVGFIIFSSTNMIDFGLSSMSKTDPRVQPYSL